MPTNADASVVFRDLRDALITLDEAVGSPRDVRRAFSRYVELSQRLTSAMRKDYSRLTGGKWEASLFTDWTVRTELLRYLRNQDQHGHQVFITVCETQHHTIPFDVEVPGFPSDVFVVNGTWNLTDHMLTEPPKGLEVCLSDPGVNPGAKDFLKPLRVEYRYVLLPRDKNDKDRFERAGASDVHELAHETFETLRKYHELFSQKLGI